MFRDQLLSELSPAEQYDINVAMVTTLARLHSIDWQAIGLADFGGKGEGVTMVTSIPSPSSCR